ncbi:hypothetical protein [Variovorax gossypii]
MQNSKDLKEKDPEAPATWWIFLFGGGILSLIHLKVLLTPGFYLAWGVMLILLAVLTLLALVVEFRNRRINRLRMARLADVYWLFVGGVGIGVLAMIVAAYFVSVQVAGRLTYEWLSDPATNKVQASWLVCLLAISIGFMLWWFRLKARCCYGAVEVFVGMCVAVFQTQAVAPGVAVLDRNVLLALLTAAVYLIVRGLDNVHQGWKAERPDPVVNMIAKRLKKSRLAPSEQQAP